MAIIEKNECCGCAVPAYPCMGENCPNRHVHYLACDECGTDETETKLYLFDDDYVLCEKCLLKQFEEVTIDNNY